MSQSPDESSTAQPAPPVKKWSSKALQLIPVAAGLLLVVGFFLVHQVLSTGFFAPDFGPLLASLFYASLLYPLIIVAVGGFAASKNLVFVVVLLGSTLWTITTVWLYVLFPLDFSHLNDFVPAPLHFVLGWVNNDVGKTLTGIFVIGSVAFIPFDVWQYLKERG